MNTLPTTRNYTANITSYMYSSKSPIPDAHTYYILDHSGECVEEFDSYKDAREYYINQSPEHLVGAWLVYAVKMVTIQ